MRTPLLAPLNLIMVARTFLASGCVFEREVVPRERYYDRDHHRWYHEHSWVACDNRDPHCHD
jgi:hypothetical protein